MPITPWLVHFWHLHLYCLTFKTVTIIMLEYACRIRTSSPGLTLAKALDEAYSRCKQSGTHKVVKTQFQGSPNEYSVSQYTKFILQHRLWHLVAILLPLFIVCTLYESSLSQLLGTGIRFWIEAVIIRRHWELFSGKVNSSSIQVLRHVSISVDVHCSVQRDLVQRDLPLA